jgi:CubicO group peptidase (beta-lactamase class C family)
VPSSLPRSSPTAQHVDPRGVLAFIDTLDARPDIEMHSFMLLRHGHVVAEGWWHPYSADRPQLLYSLSKSFTATAAAFAAAEGLLDLDDTIVSHFPEFDRDITDPGSRSIRIRHVAAMASGHTDETWQRALANDPHEPVRGFLLIPPDQPPGTVFAYNQSCTYSLASIVQRRAGTRLTQYLRPRLFDPLGIGAVGWQAYPPGRELGFSGLHARTEDVAKLGQLYLQNGRWGGTQLLAADWVALATSRRVDNAWMNPDWHQGYGFQFWMSRHGYRGDGAFGQFCVVLPEHDMVVVTSAATADMQAILDAMWTHLLPALELTSAEVGSEAKLAARLSGLELATLQADAAPRDWEPWLAGPFTVAPRGDTPRAEPPLSSIQLQRSDDAEWRVTLNEAANMLSFDVGSRGWAVSTPVDTAGRAIPVAATGGWVDQKSLLLNVIFLETPHRMDILCSLDDHCARAAWRLPPLGDSHLQNLRSPV